MRVPNRFHNSGKPPKRKLKPQALRARKAALKALKKKLLPPNGGFFVDCPFGFTDDYHLDS